MVESRCQTYRIVIEFTEDKFFHMHRSQTKDVFESFKIIMELNHVTKQEKHTIKTNGITPNPRVVCPMLE
jgi:hypothetical protein